MTKSKFIGNSPSVEMKGGGMKKSVEGCKDEKRYNTEGKKERKKK